MSILNRKEYLVLGLGDILIFLLSLWLMLALRYGDALDQQIFYVHLAPFSLLVVVWVAVFFIAGLYEKHTILLVSRLPNTVLKAALANSFLAVIFFYFIPYFGIAPKVNLFVYLFISSFLILFWRMYGYRFLYAKKKQKSLIIGAGSELSELVSEINQNERYSIRFAAWIDINNFDPSDFKKKLAECIESEQVTIVAVDLQNKNIEPMLPDLYDLIYKNVQFIDAHQLYEEIFDRIPLSLITYEWFLRNISLSPKVTYDLLKRIMDTALSFVLALASLVFYPFICAAVKLDDGGEIFSMQQRVGKNNRAITLLKFRTMTKANDGGKWNVSNENKVTRVGRFLRVSRLDELPQLWNVLKGDLSLIGPRPEFPEPVKIYERHVPYYNVRHLIKPGLSGWAQLYHDNHPHHRVDIEETRVKLSYDLYYIKNRSFFLDLKIALKTLKTLLSRSGV